MSESEVNLAIADLMSPEQTKTPARASWSAPGANPMAAAPGNAPNFAPPPQRAASAAPRVAPSPPRGAPRVAPYVATTDHSPAAADPGTMNWASGDDRTAAASQFAVDPVFPKVNLPSDFGGMPSRYEPDSDSESPNQTNPTPLDYGNVDHTRTTQTPPKQVQYAQPGNAHDEVENTVTPAAKDMQHYVRMGSVLCALLIVVVGGWATLTSINGAIVSTATVVVEGNAHNVQHLEGGIVSEILVREGQLVETGAVVARLDNTKATSRVEFLEAQIASFTNQIDLIGEELKGLNQLLEKGLARKSQVLGVKRRQAELVGQRNESLAQIKSAKDDSARSEVRAPIAGTVHQLNTEKIGTVLKAGESIMLLVPKENKLVLEARLQPRNIDQVRVGQNAVVRFPSFDARTTPELNGSVSLVSADLAKESDDTPAFYKLLIELSGDEIARLGGKTLRPGMPAEVYVQTNQRTVLSYLLKPLSDQINRTFREE